MRKVLAIIGWAALLGAALTFAAATSKKGTAKKKSDTTRKSAPRKSSSKARSRKRSAQTWRNRQLQPSPERYKEIQAALAHKGYLQGEPTGTWDQPSADALRRFQQDQKLEATGKIDSVSLIALGLGPKYDNASALPAQSRPAQP